MTQKNLDKENIKNDKATKIQKNKTQNSTDEEKKIVEELKVKLKSSEDRALRLLAETENLRKRHIREIGESQQYAIQNFALSLLSITDNFQRALKAVPEKVPDDNLLKNLIIGIQALEKEFYETFEKHGITKFSSVNKKFDPEYHQAVSKISSAKVEKGFVSEELQCGFKIGDRLLRPSMVVVSEGAETKSEGTETKKDDATNNEKEKLKKS